MGVTIPRNNWLYNWYNENAISINLIKNKKENFVVNFTLYFKVFIHDKA